LPTKYFFQNRIPYDFQDLPSKKKKTTPHPHLTHNDATSKPQVSNNTKHSFNQSKISYPNQNKTQIKFHNFLRRDNKTWNKPAILKTLHYFRWGTIPPLTKWLLKSLTLFILTHRNTLFISFHSPFINGMQKVINKVQETTDFDVDSLKLSSGELTLYSYLGWKFLPVPPKWKLARQRANFIIIFFIQQV